MSPVQLRTSSKCHASLCGLEEGFACVRKASRPVGSWWKIVPERGQENGDHLPCPSVDCRCVSLVALYKGPRMPLPGFHRLGVPQGTGEALEVAPAVATRRVGFRSGRRSFCVPCGTELAQGAKKLVQLDYIRKLLKSPLQDSDWYSWTARASLCSPCTARGCLRVRRASPGDRHCEAHPRKAPGAEPGPKGGGFSWTQ